MKTVVSMYISVLLLGVLLLTSCGGVPEPAKKPVVAPVVKKVSGPEVTIGEQVWMGTNLDVSTFRNGDPIPQVTDDREWELAGQNGQPAWCWYNNDPNMDKRYGKLYNWHAVNDPRGLAPEGWRVPSNEDYNELKSKLGGLPTVGRRLKSAQGWVSDGNGSDDVGFKVLPGGARGVTSGFKGQGAVAVFWTTTENSANFAKYRVLHATRTDMYEEEDFKGSGFAVRCIKD